jgi:hypothetical protein
MSSTYFESHRQSPFLEIPKMTDAEFNSYINTFTIEENDKIMADFTERSPGTAEQNQERPDCNSACNSQLTDERLPVEALLPSVLWSNHNDAYCEGLQWSGPDYSGFPSSKPPT